MAVDNKKEQEREELHRAIWAIADKLRGAVDGWDFKNYVLGTMFYRYISENLTAYINEGEEAAGNKGFDYAKLTDAEAEEAREERGLEEVIQDKGQKDDEREQQPLPALFENSLQVRQIFLCNRSNLIVFAESKDHVVP